MYDFVATRHVMFFSPVTPEHMRIGQVDEKGLAQEGLPHGKNVNLGVYILIRFWCGVTGGRAATDLGLGRGVGHNGLRVATAGKQIPGLFSLQRRRCVSFTL